MNLDERIKIFKMVGQVKNESGFLSSTDSLYYECWAGYRALSGKAFAERQATSYKRVDSFVVRYCNKTKALLQEDLEQYYIVFNGAKYKIVYPYDIKNEKKYIDLECVLYG